MWLLGKLTVNTWRRTAFLEVCMEVFGHIIRPNIVFVIRGQFCGIEHEARDFGVRRLSDGAIW
jgi:hypothetical protein